MRIKPFCLALGKDWTSKPSKTDLREIHTNLKWTQKVRKECEVESENLQSLIQLLDDKDFQEQGPVRILVQGTYTYSSRE